MDIKRVIVSFFQLPLVIDVFHRKTDSNINKPTRHIFYLYQTDMIEDLAKKVAKIYNTSWYHVVFLLNWNRKLCKEFHAQESIDSLSAYPYPLACYIVKDWNNEYTKTEIRNKKLELYLANICHITLVSTDNNNNNDAIFFGYPFVITYLNVTTNRELYALIYERLFMWIGDTVFSRKPPYLNKNIKDDNYIKPTESMIEQYQQEWDLIFIDLPFKLRVFENDMSMQEWSSALNNVDRSNIITIDDERCVANARIAIEWTCGSYEIIKGIINKVVVDWDYRCWKKQKVDDVKRICFD